VTFGDVDQAFVYAAPSSSLLTLFAPAPARIFFDERAKREGTTEERRLFFLISFLLSSILLLPPLPHTHHITMLRSLTRAARPAAIALARSSPVVRSSSPPLSHTCTLTCPPIFFFYSTLSPPFTHKCIIQLQAVGAHQALNTRRQLYTTTTTTASTTINKHYRTTNTSNSYNSNGEQL
jgi:hypothetical protein